MSPGVAKTGVKRQRHSQPYQRCTSLVPGALPPIARHDVPAPFRNRQQGEEENDRDYLPGSLVFTQTLRG